jgi:hypothetical protein
LQIQFTTAMIMGINGIKSGCDFPLWMQYMLVIYMISFIVLFGNFYAKAYIEKVGGSLLEAGPRSTDMAGSTNALCFQGKRALYGDGSALHNGYRNCGIGKSKKLQ